MRFLGKFWIGLTLSLYAQNVGIGTATPQQRLHVDGKVIAHDGQTGAPAPSTWGSAGSRLIMRPGSPTTYPYELGITDTSLWYSVPQGAQHSFWHGGNEVFAITPTTRNIVNVGGNINYPSIWLGRLRGLVFNNTGPYPKRGTFVFFGGPTNDFEDNTDPPLMYFVHLNSNISRLRLHIEDDGLFTRPSEYDGFSILANSCNNNSCMNLSASQLLFDFVSDGNAYKPGGGSWAAISDRRTKAAVRPYTRGLAELRQLQPVSYQYGERYFPAFKDKWYTGLIAQEAQEVLPEIVHPYKLQVPGDSLVDVLALDPSDLTYLLINAVKELDAENARLKAENTELKRRIAAVEERLAQIEEQVKPRNP